MSYYLKILILSTFVPVIFSFHPKVKFYIYYKSIFRATLLVSTVYILWDIIFTKLGIWGFNNQYLNGIYIFNLPIEEILFFLCIPFCCLYTYHLVEKFNISFFKKLSLEKNKYIFLIYRTCSWINKLYKTLHIYLLYHVFFSIVYCK